MNAQVQTLQAFAPSQRISVSGMGSSSGGTGRGSSSSTSRLLRRMSVLAIANGDINDDGAAGDYFHRVRNRLNALSRHAA